MSLFDKTLIRIQQELRDLKTSHLIGAGTTQFFTRSITITPTTDLRVRLIIADDEPLPPFLAVIYPNGTLFTRTNAPSNRTYTFYAYAQAGFSGDVVAISSSIIDTLEQYTT